MAKRAANSKAAVRQVAADLESQIIVGFKNSIRTQNRETTVARVNKILDRLRELPATVLKCYVSKPFNGVPASALGVIRLDESKVTLEDLQQALKSKRKDLEGIAFFERNAPIALCGFNDPLLRDQWALSILGVTEPWTTTAPTGSPILVAVIDSGLRRHDGTLHEDVGRVESVADCQPQPTASPSYPGLYLDNVDQDGHGTFLAGTISAASDNGKGIASAIPGNWNISLLPVKFFGTDAPPSVDNAVAAIDHAISKGARVINASWHVALGVGERRSLRDALARAKQADCLVVVAAGNDGTDNSIYPTFPANYGSAAQYPNLAVLTVAATDRRDSKAAFSNYGAAIIDIAAPGVRIQTTGRYLVDPPRYPAYSGTSASAAYASAGAALVLALNPTWEPKHVIDHLTASADVVPGLATTCIGGRRLNLRRAVYGPLQVTAPAQGDTVTAGQAAQITWTNDYDNPRFTHVKIEFSKDGGTNYRVVDASVVNALGTYAWTPRNTDRTTTGRIRIAPRRGEFPAVSGQFTVA